VQEHHHQRGGRSSASAAEEPPPGKIPPPHAARSSRGRARRRRLLGSRRRAVRRCPPSIASTPRGAPPALHPGGRSRPRPGGGDPRPPHRAGGREGLAAACADRASPGRAPWQRRGRRRGGGGPAAGGARVSSPSPRGGEREASGLFISPSPLNGCSVTTLSNHNSDTLFQFLRSFG
jgi:hypothetical protein